MILDIFVLLVFFISGLIAFLRGFIRESLTVLGLVGAFICAFFGGPILTPFMKGWLGVDPASEEVAKLFGVVPMDMVAVALSYGLIFIIVIIVLSLVSHILAEAVKSLGLGAVDRTMGVVFGLLRAVLVLGILYLLPYSTVSAEKRQEWFGSSRTYVYLEKVSGFLASFIPDAPDSGDDDMSKKVKKDPVEDALNEAREKLKALDVLREDLTPQERAELMREKFDDEEIKTILKDKGYSDEFRDQMESLFAREAADGQSEDFNVNE